MAEKAKPSVWDRLEVDIEREGRVIKLPNDPEAMPIRKAIEALVRKAQDEEQTFRVHEVIEAYPLDAAVAFIKAMQRLYGWASPKSTPGFFGPNPPEMLSVQVGPNPDDVVQCPVGAFKLPGVDNDVNTVIHNNQFIIHAEIKKKDKHLLLELATETRRIVREESIYKGKALKMHVDDEGELDTDNPPEFIDLSGVSEADVLFDDDIRAQVEVNMLVPMKHTHACRRNKIPLKRGILLAGPFGTGKTLLARVAAKVAQDHGWTFVLLNRVQGLRAVLEFCQNYGYGPAMVMAEDIDRIAEERDDQMNDLINTIDGVVSKRSEIMVVLTTNHAEKLNPVILRPGRLDAIITLRAPGAETVQKLIRHYARDLIGPNTDLENAGKELAGQIPASIRECIERSKLAMIGRGDEKLADSDIVVSAQTMKNHLELLNKKVREESVAEKLAASLKEVVSNGNDIHFAALERKVDTISKAVVRR